MAIQYSIIENQDAIRYVAEQNGIDPCILLAIAYIETGGSFNNLAYNSAGFAGLFQLSDGYSGLTGDDRYDPYFATQAVIDGMARNLKVIHANNIPMENAWYYLAHQHGAQGFVDEYFEQDVDIHSAKHSSHLLKQATDPMKSCANYPYSTVGDFFTCWKNEFYKRYSYFCGDDGTGTIYLILIFLALYGIGHFYLKLI